MKNKIQNLLLAPSPASAWSALPETLMRLCFGAFFAIAGWNKLTIDANRAQMLKTITEAQIPFPDFMAPTVASFEFAAGLLLLLGLGTRLMALILFTISTVALVTVGLHQIPPGLGPFSWFSWFMYLPEPLYMLLALLLMVKGGGCFSADALAARRLRRAV